MARERLIRMLAKPTCRAAPKEWITPWSAAVLPGKPKPSAKAAAALDLFKSALQALLNYSTTVRVHQSPASMRSLFPAPRRRKMPNFKLLSLPTA